MLKESGDIMDQILSEVKYQNDAKKGILNAHSTFLFTSPFVLKNLGLHSAKIVRKTYY
jgi:hypothetical protein